MSKDHGKRPSHHVEDAGESTRPDHIDNLSGARLPFHIGVEHEEGDHTLDNTHPLGKAKQEDRDACHRGLGS